MSCIHTFTTWDGITHQQIAEASTRSPGFIQELIELRRENNRLKKIIKGTKHDFIRK